MLTFARLFAVACSDLVHVEVYVGGGSANEATIGSRYEGADFVGVALQDSYTSFGGHGAHGHQRLFRSIDRWLEGVCVSACKTCTWGETKPGTKSRLFSAQEA